MIPIQKIAGSQARKSRVELLRTMVKTEYPNRDDRVFSITVRCGEREWSGALQ
jgi:hypothetical protein